MHSGIGNSVLAMPGLIIQLLRKLWPGYNLRRLVYVNGAHGPGPPSAPRAF
jgi:hypothetical protein